VKTDICQYCHEMRNFCKCPENFREDGEFGDGVTLGRDPGQTFLGGEEEAPAPAELSAVDHGCRVLSAEESAEVVRALTEVKTTIPTMNFRWNIAGFMWPGKLQQGWLCMETGEMEWIDVPTVTQ
jgi:hypothetical protein